MKINFNEILRKVLEQSKGCQYCLKIYKYNNYIEEITFEDIKKICIDSNCPTLEYISRYCILMEEMERIINE